MNNNQRDEITKRETSFDEKNQHTNTERNNQRRCNNKKINH
jgi:hypothetical protein